MFYSFFIAQILIHRIKPTSYPHITTAFAQPKRVFLNIMGIKIIKIKNQVI